LLCPEGIVMAADKRITYRLDPLDPMKLGYVDDVTKIYRVQKADVGISYWGLAELSGKTMLKHLSAFENSSVKKGDTVDDIAEQLKLYFEKCAPSIDCRMGLHVTGYVKRDGRWIPRLRHVFHTSWLESREFVNEDCHREYHFPNGNKMIYGTEIQYPPLFNGDNLIANALFNYAPNVRPYYSIIPNLLSLKDCISLAKLVVDISIERLNYFFDQRHFQKIPATVGGGITMARLTEKRGFEWLT